MTLIDSHDGLTLSLTGELRQAFVDNRLLNYAPFETMAKADPTMAKLQAALSAATPIPLDRSVLLKGDGWSRLFIELTGQCNENCLHCYAEASPSVTQALSEAQVLGALDDALSLGFTSVQLTGGDPLISKTCLSAASYAKDLGFPLIEIYTNGLALKGNLFKELAALDIAFAFSIYGQDALVHDHVTRTNGSHRLTLEAISKTVSAGLRVRVGIIDTGTTGFNLNQTLALMRSLGVDDDAVYWDVERQVGRGSFNSPLSFEPSADTLDEQINFQVEKGTTGEASDQTQALYHGDDHFLDEQTNPLDQQQNEAQAHQVLSDAFRGTAAVSYSGNVYPCIFTRDRPLGDIRQESLRDILERPDKIYADAKRLGEDIQACSESLTCWRCRIRSSLLSGAAS